eukprot:2411720-Alexandrium_andersonii.AAC.1
MSDGPRICQLFQDHQWRRSEVGASWLELLIWFELNLRGPVNGTTSMLVDALLRVFRKRARK